MLNKLRSYLKNLADGGLCVAFSGGVDSAVILKAASEVCGDVHAVTVRTIFHPPGEDEAAGELARGMGAKFHTISLDDMPGEIMQNPPERCYLCKKLIFSRICGYAAENRLSSVLDGTNADDLNEYRPGLRALRELGVKSPLAQLGFSKADVRAIARELGLAVAEKPSAPCLATRLPYNTTIDPLMLIKVDALENELKFLGILTVRARLQGDTVRLEIPPECFDVAVQNRLDIIKKGKELGFLRITLDLEGFRSGSFDAEQQKILSMDTELHIYD